MMVNETNKNRLPWPSTIPDQMPWFDPSACPPETPMQFLGQQPYDATQIPPLLPNPVVHPENHTVSSMIYNPFYPQQVTGMQPCQTPSTEVFTQIDPQLPSASSFVASLTHMPNLQSNQAINHKRSSFEMEDDLTSKEAPPTKQQLSESKLFQRFGSLNLDTESSPEEPVHPIDCEDEDLCESSKYVTKFNDRKEFNRYVYLLFKDKESDGQLPIVSGDAIDRLLREERQKLSKAVILWNPPPRTTFVEGSDDSDEEEDYRDHRDFLKSTVKISEVEEDSDIKIESD